MADYQAFPLWADEPHGAMLAPERVPLSEGLRADLTAWAVDFDETLSANNYEWPDDETFKAWNNRGRALAVRVQSELGHTNEVVFWNAETGEAESVPPTAGTL